MTTTFRTGATAVAALILGATSLMAQQTTHVLRVRVLHDLAPIHNAAVRMDSAGSLTDDRGEVRFRVTAGLHVLRVRELGFAPDSANVSVTTDTLIVFHVREQAIESEALVATSTRTGTLIRDQPIRVEALPQEEIEENLTIAPGNLTTLLNELAGLHVQITSAGSGATVLRVRGFPGRLTQVLVDGLPLLGPDGGGFGLLQTPPLDLGRVEVIKGVASALYGGSALGGVVNLVSKQPGGDPAALINRTSTGGTDAAAFASARLSPSAAFTVIGGVNQQDRVDADGDGWADLAGYRRATVRPRLFLGAGTKSLLGTVGFVTESRYGGTLAGLSAAGAGPFVESIDTRRADAGVNARTLLSHRYILSVRGSVMRDAQDRVYGPSSETDTRTVSLGELSLGGSAGANTWVGGVAIETDRLRTTAAGVDYSYTVPAAFVQDEYALAHWIVLSASGRVDKHNVYGTFTSPRVNALLRLPYSLTARLSAGTGFAAPTPLTDQTAATGLRVLNPLTALKAEKARAASVDVNWKGGPLEIDASVFASELRSALDIRSVLPDSSHLQLYNELFPENIKGTELVARYSYGLLHVIGSYTFIDAKTGASTLRRDAVLTPRQGGEIGAILESETRGRIGMEVSYNGRERLRDRVYRTYSKPYLEVNGLAEIHFLGDNGLFINGINLTDVRQTRTDPLVRPKPGPGGRRTTDVWQPLAGRMFNVGLRLEL